MAAGLRGKNGALDSTRVDLNEYKRAQAAPGIKVTSRAFGLGRRMPIAQQYVDLDSLGEECPKGA